MQSYQCGSSKKNTIVVACTYTKVAAQYRLLFYFFAENELLARSYNSKSKMKDCKKKKKKFNFNSLYLLCKIILSAKNGVLLPILATTSANVSTVAMMNSRLVKKQTNKNNPRIIKSGYCL